MSTLVRTPNVSEISRPAEAGKHGRLRARGWPLSPNCGDEGSERPSRARNATIFPELPLARPHAGRARRRRASLETMSLLGGSALCGAAVRHRSGSTGSSIGGLARSGRRRCFCQSRSCGLASECSRRRVRSSASPRCRLRDTDERDCGRTRPPVRRHGGRGLRPGSRGEPLRPSRCPSASRRRPCRGFARR